MLLFLLLQTAAIWSIFFATGIVNEAKLNAFETFNGRVENRRAYLQNDMVLRWGNIGNTAVTVSENIHDVLSRYALTHDDLYKNTKIATKGAESALGATAEASDLVLFRVINELTGLISNNSVTGAFVSLLPSENEPKAKGLYLRCETPQTVEAKSLYITIASATLSGFMTQNQIGTGDKYAAEQFLLQGDPYLVQPYSTYKSFPQQWAFSDEARACGYWATPHSVVPNGSKVISYSMPLIYENSLYGVIGIDLSTSHLEKSLPYHEINNDQHGAYAVATQTQDNKVQTFLRRGTDFNYYFGSEEAALTLKKASKIGSQNYETHGSMHRGTVQVYCAELKMYDSQSAFRGQNWVFMGLMPENALLRFANRLLLTLILSFLAGDVIGVVLLVFVTRHITARVNGLPEKVAAFSANGTKIERTGLHEIDVLIGSIEELRGAVLENSEKMSQIIELSNVPLATFEIDLETKQVTFAGKMAEITDRNYFHGAVAADDFISYLSSLDIVQEESDETTQLYGFVDHIGASRWITVRSVENQKRIYGIVQDVTDDRLDRNRIEHERDFDLLTGILNRRAFLSRATKAIGQMQETQSESVQNPIGLAIKTLAAQTENASAQTENASAQLLAQSGSGTDGFAQNESAQSKQGTDGFAQNESAQSKQGSDGAQNESAQSEAGSDRSARYAALVSLDMDNLKVINDTFGHEQGDVYLRSMAKTLKAFIASGEQLISRLAGDEFVVFLYGYTDKALLCKEIAELKEYILSATILMPNNQKLKLRCSAGVAYYPDDAVKMDDLLLYADFAMYEIKQTTRGEFSDFDRDRYNKREYRSRSYESLNTLIERERVAYDYQPIVSVSTGDAFGYEALMRPLEPDLHNAQEVLAMARAQHKLYQIERLTWFKALEGFSRLSPKHADKHLFVNSIPSEVLTGSDISDLEQLYPDLLSGIIMEFTEDEKYSEERTRLKKETIQRWGGSIALDDFGTGYNGETVLLMLGPHFIKVDMFIIRDININTNKQKLLQNVVSYAVEHNVAVIAEGVETRQELETVIACGVDYVQGYYVARPSLDNPDITPEMRREIRELYAAVYGKKARKKHRPASPDSSGGGCDFGSK